MNPLILAQEIIDGRRITREDDLSYFLTCDLDELCEGADRIREAYIGDKVDLCSIINGRSGRCPENCKYCAQSVHHHTSCEIYDFLPEEKILEACKMNEEDLVSGLQCLAPLEGTIPRLLCKMNSLGRTEPLRFSGVQKRHLVLTVCVDRCQLRGVNTVKAVFATVLTYDLS